MRGFKCASVNAITAFIIETNDFVVVPSGIGYINKVTVMSGQLRRLTGEPIICNSLSRNV